MKTLTKRRQQLLDFWRGYQQKHGVPPTFRDAATAMGIGSTNGISGHVNVLLGLGLLTRAAGPSSSRGIVVACRKDCCPTCGAATKVVRKGK
jgi:SOS-response transcriptional repressor LexA